MPSSAKTEKLGLNNWAGADTPKRADFNQDNRILDEKLGGHLENEDARYHFRQGVVERAVCRRHLFWNQRSGTDNSAWLPSKGGFSDGCRIPTLSH